MMGFAFSRLKRKTSDSNYERILAELDDLIRKTEIKISERHMKEKRVLGGLLVYSLSIYLVLIACSLMLLQDQAWKYKLIFIAFLIIYPLLIFAMKRFLSFIYSRWLGWDQVKLENLRAKQKHKVEELKTKTAYYATKTLLDRYDSPAGSPLNINRIGSPIVMTKFEKQDLNAKTDSKRREHETPLKVYGEFTTPSHQKNAVNFPTENTRGKPSIQELHIHFFGNFDRLGEVPIAEQHMPLPIRTWADKLIDFVVGEGPGTKYALICSYCHGHNGLSTLEDFSSKEFACLYCRRLNKARCTIHEVESVLKIEAHSKDAEHLKLSDEPSDMREIDLTILPTNSDENSSRRTE